MRVLKCDDLENFVLVGDVATAGWQRVDIELGAQRANLTT